MEDLEDNLPRDPVRHISLCSLPIPSSHLLQISESSKPSAHSSLNHDKVLHLLGSAHSEPMHHPKWTRVNKHHLRL